MEFHDILNIDDPIKMSCLQHVYAQRIQRDLTNWANAHNRRGVRTERNKSPWWLWHVGVSRNRNRDSTAINNLKEFSKENVEQKVADFYANSVLEEPDDIRVVLPRIPLPLSEEKLQELNTYIDVLRSSDHGAMDIYGDVYSFVIQHAS